MARGSLMQAMVSACRLDVTIALAKVLLLVLLWVQAMVAVLEVD
jgi:hypothetical protein